jgi:hypothetical protein
MMVNTSVPTVTLAISRPGRSRGGVAVSRDYRHLRRRNDLLDLMVDHAFADYRPPLASGRWRADVVSEYLQLLWFLRARPWMLDIIALRPAMTPHVVDFLERVLGHLASHPASGASKMETYGLLTGIVQTHALQERRNGVLDEEFLAAQAFFLHRFATDGSHPHLGVVLSDMPTAPTETMDDRLARILATVLDGMLPKPRPHRTQRK